MFARIAAIALALLAGPASAQARLPAGPPVRDLLAACDGKDGWADPAPPVRVFANVYQVGTCGITVLLLAGDEGHVLIDSGPLEAAPLVAANIQALGFALGDVEWIVTSHEHHDHVGGVAELKRLTGARLAARAAAKGPLESGRLDWRDPQAELKQTFAGAAVERILHDGERLVLGNVDLTVHATPGHSPGSTSWSWRSCDERECRAMVYADSVTAVSADGYRFSRQPVYVDAFARSLGKIAALPCEILLTPHPSASDLHARLAGERRLVDADGCLDYALAGQTALEARLAREGPGR
ncbi:MAG TPA: subclass B3 metallo-beta-lactamase [Croceibacterium sp.]|nr:subclass B3 metallo-beta-lactamase [Croceibacterium sp.]